MMAEQDDSFEKTEEPTPKKLEDARKKGQVVRSKELTTTLLLLFSAFALISVGQYIASAMFGITQRSFMLSRDETYDIKHMFQILEMAVLESAWPLIGFIVIAMIGGIYGSVAMGGYNFTWSSAAPKGTRETPAAGT